MGDRKVNEREAVFRVVGYCQAVLEDGLVGIDLLAYGQRLAKGRKHSGLEKALSLVRQQSPKRAAHAVVLHGHFPPLAIAEPVQHAAGGMKPIHQRRVESDFPRAGENVWPPAPWILPG